MKKVRTELEKGSIASSYPSKFNFDLAHISTFSNFPTFTFVVLIVHSSQSSKSPPLFTAGTLQQSAFFDRIRMPWMRPLT